MFEVMFHKSNPQPEARLFPEFKQFYLALIPNTFRDPYCYHAHRNKHGCRETCCYARAESNLPKALLSHMPSSTH